MPGYPAERWTEVGGLRVAYLEAGEGAPVLLLQGGVIDYPTLSWKHTIGPLAERFRVIAPTLPGYGQSDRPSAPCTTAFYVDFLLAFLDRVGLERVDLVSLSMSGALALGLTLRAPDRVKRLVLVDAYGMQARVPFHRLAYLLVRVPGLAALSRRLLRRSPVFVRLGFGPFLEQLPDELVRDVQEAARLPEAGEAFIAWLRHEIEWRGVRSDFTNRMPEIAPPVLLLHGARDWLMPVACAEHAARLIPNATLQLIPGSRHWTPREQPEHVNQALLAFLGNPEPVP